MSLTAKRILIIGCSGAGKSTLTRKLAAKTKLPVIHLDQAYWKPNWEETPKEEWEAKVKDLAAGEHWIMDGNYSGTFSLRIPRADMVVYLDYPAHKCLWRVAKRVWKYHGKTRPDMPAGCNERFDLDFFHYVAVFNLTRRKSILKQLENLQPAQRCVVLRNDSEVEHFLANA